MRATVERKRPDLLASVVELMGQDPFPRVDEGTQFAQPAIFCASLAGWAALGCPSGEAMAGHSLGELTALVAAGCMTEHDGLGLVTLRGRVMQDAGERAGDGGMLALLGAGAADQADQLAAAQGLTVANDNCPTQVVLSGPRSALAAAAEAAAELGLRAMAVPVTGAFHSPMMEAAVPRFEAAVAEVALREPRVPVLSAVTAKPFDDVRRRLVEALISPVRWRDTMLELQRMGVDRFVEVGPGRVLTGLAKRTVKNVELVHG